MVTMATLTEKEKKALLVLLKDFTAFYNANSISKVLGMSRVGALKMFRRMEKGGLIRSQTIGKSIVYKLRLEDDYVRKLAAFLLAEEANNFKRWKEEFKPLFRSNRIALLFGSSTINYEKAADIDLLVAVEKKEREEVEKLLEERRQVLPKKLHSIILTPRELLSNIKRKDAVILDIVRKGIILYGQDSYVEVMKNVSGQ